MRVKLVLANDTDQSGITEATFKLMSETLPNTGKVEFTDENPDVIHVFGEWDRKAMTVARDAIAKHIAIVQSPLSSMAPWKNPSSSKQQMTANMQAVITSGQIEYDYLQDEKQPGHVRTVKNAITTATITKDKMAAEILQIYKEVIEQTDKELWQRAEKQMGLINEEDEIIKGLCKKFIYASYLNRRKNIPHSFLVELRDTMHKSEYNEDRMAEILRLIKLDEFTARLESVMQEDCNLMEGYMPIPALGDKAAKKLANCITNYQNVQ